MRYLKNFENNTYLTKICDILERSSVHDDNDSKILLSQVKTAIKNGADVNEISYDNISPLILSSIFRSKYYIEIDNVDVYAEIVTELINAGAYIDHIDRDGRSALIWSANRRNFDAMIILIEAGADWNIIDIYNEDFLGLLNNDDKNKIIKKYTVKYQDYLVKKDSEKFNL